MQLHLWSPEVWPRAADGSVELPGAATVLPSQEPPLLDALEEVPPNLTPAQVGAALVWLGDNLQSFSAKELARARRKAADEAEHVLA